MSELRDKAWAQIEARHANGAARKIARRALSIRFEEISDAARHSAKRCLLDALGCAIGAYQAPGRPICEAYADEIGGRGEATLIGSGAKSSVLNATLVNCFLVRYLDYNDLGGGGHNSDSIPALLAAAEAEDRSGADLLTAIVISYELGERFLECFDKTASTTAGHHAVTGVGWCSDIRGGINMPPALGGLLGLSEEQIAGAIGDTLVRCLPLNHLDANDEEFVMSKNLRFGFVAQHALTACKLARLGFTGPQMGLDGEFGFNDTVLDGKMNPDHLIGEDGDWRINKATFKNICANFTTHTSIQSTLELAAEHDIAPEDVAAFTVIACAREAKHTSYAAKQYPRNGESADHSLYYGNAHALIHRHFGPSAFRAEKYTDPEILRLIELIDVEVREDWPRLTLQGGVRITLKDGRVLEKILDEPKGWTADPMSDADLEQKFRSMAQEFMPAAQTDALINTIWSLSDATSVRPLTALLAFAD